VANEAPPFRIVLRVKLEAAVRAKSAAISVSVRIDISGTSMRGIWALSTGLAWISRYPVADEYGRVSRKTGLGLKQQAVARYAQ
jgi:hypothetical protein